MKKAASELLSSGSEVVNPAIEPANTRKKAGFIGILKVNSAPMLVNAGYQTAKFRFRSG